MFSITPVHSLSLSVDSIASKLCVCVFLYQTLQTVVAIQSAALMRTIQVVSCECYNIYQNMIVLVLLHFHISQQCLTLYRTKFHMCCCCWSSFKWYSSPSVNWGLGTIYKHQRLNYHIRISSNLSFIYFFFFSWPILGCCEYNNSGRVYNTLHLVISS